MDQDQHTCPSCGAPAPERPSCPYCGWTPELTTESSSVDAPVDSAMAPDQDSPAEQAGPPNLRDLMKEGESMEPLLDQVPEEMRGVLAARLDAASESDRPTFSEHTAATLREQGYIVSEDARGARFTATPGKASDLSSSDVVKIAADLDGGVQQQAKLPICEECQAASPVGSENCQWCGQPFATQD